MAAKAAIGQGAATSMYAVLAAATGIKLKSMDQDRLTA